MRFILVSSSWLSFFVVVACNTSILENATTTEDASSVESFPPPAATARCEESGYHRTFLGVRYMTRFDIWIQHWTFRLPAAVRGSVLLQASKSEKR
jgi:hypothetical protein